MRARQYTSMALAAVLTVAAAWNTGPAHAASLTSLSSAQMEFASQTGPLNTIDSIVTFLGYYPPLIGPGGTLTGVYFTGLDTTADAAASAMLDVPWYALWNVADTQTASQTFYWSRVLQMTAEPGTVVDVSFDYIYSNSRLNLAFDGRSESKSSASLYASIVPAAQTSSFSQDASDALSTFLLGSLILAADTPRSSDYTQFGSLNYDANYHFAAVSLADDVTSGSFVAGQMETGDRLYLVGRLSAEAQAQAYWYSIEISTMVSSLDTTAVLTEHPVAPVPEPSTFMMLGVGLFGIAAARRIRPQLATVS